MGEGVAALVERRTWAVVATVAVVVLALAGLSVWRAWAVGCLPECPTHKLYVAYDGTVEDPRGHGAVPVPIERADLEEAAPGAGDFFDRARDEDELVHVTGRAREAEVRDFFGLHDGRPGVVAEMEGHLYYVTWSRLGE